MAQRADHHEKREDLRHRRPVRQERGGGPRRVFGSDRLCRRYQGTPPGDAPRHRAGEDRCELFPGERNL